MEHVKEREDMDLDPENADAACGARLLAVLHVSPDASHRSLIGNALYSKIIASLPIPVIERAGKITGMFLEALFDGPAKSLPSITSGRTRVFF